MERVVTQAERRAQTRTALLDAAAELFAERGIDGASIDAIADAAGRTSGAVYDHFGGKDGLLFALLDEWVGAVAVVVGAELATAETLEQAMAAVWRNVSDPIAGEGRWLGLEHELWSYAVRNAGAQQRLADRYRAMWAGIDEAFASGPASVGPALVGLLLGLDMMRRIDPAAVTDDLAIAALCGVVTGATGRVRS